MTLNDKALCEVLSLPTLDRDLEEYLQLPSVRSFLEKYFSCADDIPPGEGGQLARTMRVREERNCDKIELALAPHRKVPSPVIRSATGGEILELHDRHTQAAAFAPGLTSEQNAPLWSCHSEQELARSRVAFGSHLAGSSDVVGFTPKYSDESAAFVRAFHGCNIGVSLPGSCSVPRQAPPLSECRLWHFLSTALVFPADKAAYCTLCTTTMRIDPPWTTYIRAGWLAPLAGMDWAKAVKSFIKHLEYHASHHALECPLEADCSSGRYNNTFPLVVIVDPCFRGRRTAEILPSDDNQKASTLAPLQSLPEEIREVVRELRRFYAARSRMPRSPLPAGFGMIGAYLQPFTGRLIVYQRLKSWAPADSPGSVFTLGVNQSPFDDALGYALLRRSIGGYIREVHDQAPPEPYNPDYPLQLDIPHRPSCSRECTVPETSDSSECADDSSITLENAPESPGHVSFSSAGVFVHHPSQADLPLSEEYIEVDSSVSNQEECVEHVCRVEGRNTAAISRCGATSLDAVEHTTRVTPPPKEETEATLNVRRCHQVFECTAHLNDNASKATTSSFQVEDLAHCMRGYDGIPSQHSHDPMRTMKPKKAKFYELLPRTHRATASQNKRNGANQIEIDGFNYDYLLDRSYWKSYVSAGLKQYYSDLYEEGLMCPVDTRIFHQFENPVVSGLLFKDLHRRVDGRVVLLSGLFAGLPENGGWMVPKAGAVMAWMREGKIPVLCCIIMTDIKVVDASPQNSAFLVCCCREHLEEALPRMRRHAVRCPLRWPVHQGPTSRPLPHMMFFGRSLAAFDSQVFESVGGEMKESGVTQGEAVLFRFLMLLVEHLSTGRPMPFGLRKLPKWALTEQELRPFDISRHGGFNQRWVSAEQHWKANASLRVRNLQPGLHHSLRAPQDLGRAYDSRPLR